VNLRDVAIGFVLGALLLGGASTLCYDASVRKLQAYSAEHARKDSAFAQSIVSWGDAIRHESDSLKHVEHITIERASIDTAAAQLAERALAEAHTVRDSNAAYRLESADLKRANLNLWRALALADQRADSLQHLSDSLQTGTIFLNGEVQRLNGKVQAMKSASPCGLGGTVGLGIRGADAVAGFTCRVGLPHIF